MTAEPLTAAIFGPSSQSRRYLRMLAVLSGPIANQGGSALPDGRPLDVWGEWQRLQASIRHTYDSVSTTSADWTVVRLVPPTAEVLRQMLISHRPGYQVLHVSCHNSAAGLTLEDERGCEDLLKTADLVEILRGSTVQLVVLHACTTDDIGQALVEQAGIACVIATRLPILGDEAQVFTAQLYTSLAAGESTGVALEHARRKMTEWSPCSNSQERAANLLLFGSPTLCLSVAAVPTREPCLLLPPTHRNHRLPFERIQGFEGRRSELLTLATWFAQSERWLFAISGVSGVGKTALALNAALRHAYRFNALAFASARGVPDFGPIQVLQALNEALDLTTTPAESASLEDAVARRLNTYAVLLVLDDLESLTVDSAQSLIRALGDVDPRSGSRVLMTLRSLEHTPLATLVDHRTCLVLSVLDDASALRLTWNEVECQRVRFDGTSGTGSPAATWSVEELTAPGQLLEHSGLHDQMQEQTRVDSLHHLSTLACCHPMIIALAVRMVAEHGWVETVHQLEHLRGQPLELALEELIGRVLTGLVARVPQVLSLLYAALVFVDGATASRLCAVAQEQPVDPESKAEMDICDTLLHLVVQSKLLTCFDQRYTLDASIRSYLERHRPPDHATYAQHIYRHAAVHLPVMADYDAAIREGRMRYSAPMEWGNITAALERLSDRSASDDDAARLFLDYARHWRNVLYNSYDPRGLSWLEAAYRAAERVGSLWECANTRKAMGDLQQQCKEVDATLASYAEALTLYCATGDRLGEAHTLRAIGNIQQRRKGGDAALASYTAALTLYRATGAKLGEANTLRAIGDLQQRRDDQSAALASYTEALTLSRATGDHLGEAQALRAIGNIQQRCGDQDTALTSYTEALALYCATGDRLGEAHTLRAIGNIQQRRKGGDAALTSYTAALTLYRAMGNRLGQANTLQAIGDLQQLRDDRAAALASYTAALTLYRAMGNRLGQANTLQAIGDLQQLCDDRAAALASYTEALTLYRAIGNRLGQANTLQAIGDLQQLRDDWSAALASYTEALTLYRAMGDRLGQANTLQAIGDLQQLRKEGDAALASYTTALTLYRATGAKLGEANALQAIGDLQQLCKEGDAALASYTEALTLYRATGDRLGEANTLRAIGDLQQLRKEGDAALASYTEALTLYRATGDRLGEANTLASLSRLWLATHFARSQQLLEQALSLHQSIDDPYSMGAVLGNYALALLKLGRSSEASPYLERARSCFISRQLPDLVDYMDRLLAQAHALEK